MTAAVDAADHLRRRTRAEFGANEATSKAGHHKPMAARIASKSDACDNGPQHTPSNAVTGALVTLYILSGVTQPLLMTICKEFGLADPSCQLYMLFYALGPASVMFTLFSKETRWPSWSVIMKGGGIAMFDISAQSLNYTGAALAGPTIFAIVYSSVTVWTAVFSRLILGRSCSALQWLGVIIVFAGLGLTATDSVELGAMVVHGLVLVVAGSAMHALTYVMSEAIMTRQDESLTVRQNCAIQGTVATTFYLLWQLFYTRPRFETLIQQPMEAAGTTTLQGMILLVSFSLANLLHALAFFHTLRYLSGGATSAGVCKGLQAVLVFVVTDWCYCGRVGGDEMCFSRIKFMSLLTVVGGVLLFGKATELRQRSGSRSHEGYSRIEEPAAGHFEMEATH